MRDNDSNIGLAMFSLWPENLVKLFRKEIIMDNDLVSESIGGGGVEVPVGMLSDVSELKYAELQTLCKQQGLSGFGKKADLIKRLTIVKEGHVSQHVHGRTKCKVCDAQAMVTGTTRATMPDGRVLVTRKMKCVGRHRHTYPLKSIEGKAKK